MVPSDETPLPNWPVAAIPQSEIDLFNRFLFLFSELKRDLALFATPKTPSDWVALFLKVGESYFEIDWEREPFFQELKILSTSFACFREKKWGFESMQPVLTHLSQNLPALSLQKCQSHHFCSPLLRAD